jgi:hypothetical protein
MAEDGANFLDGFVEFESDFHHRWPPHSLKETGYHQPTDPPQRGDGDHWACVTP